MRSKQFDNRPHRCNTWTMVFDRWRQCAPHLIHASLDPSKSKFKTVYGSVQLLLHSPRQRLTIPYIGPPIFPLKMFPSHGGIWTPSNTWFCRPILAHNPNGISILNCGSAIFAQLTAECPYTLQWAALPPQNCPFPWGDLDTCLLHGSFGPPKS